MSQVKVSPAPPEAKAPQNDGTDDESFCAQTAECVMEFADFAPKDVPKQFFMPACLAYTLLWGIFLGLTIDYGMDLKAAYDSPSQSISVNTDPFQLPKITFAPGIDVESAYSYYCDVSYAGSPNVGAGYTGTLTGFTGTDGECEVVYDDDEGEFVLDFSGVTMVSGSIQIAFEVAFTGDAGDGDPLEAGLRLSRDKDNGLYWLPMGLYNSFLGQSVNLILKHKSFNYLHEPEEGAGNEFESWDVQVSTTPKLYYDPAGDGDHTNFVGGSANCPEDGCAADAGADSETQCTYGSAGNDLSECMIFAEVYVQLLNAETLQVEDDNPLVFGDILGGLGGLWAFCIPFFTLFFTSRPNANGDSMAHPSRVARRCCCCFSSIKNAYSNVP